MYLYLLYPISKYLFGSVCIKQLFIPNTFIKYTLLYSVNEEKSVFEMKNDKLVAHTLDNF